MSVITDFAAGEIAAQNLPADLVPSFAEPEPEPTPEPPTPEPPVQRLSTPARTKGAVVPVIAAKPRAQPSKKRAPAVEEDMDVDSDGVEFVDDESDVAQDKGKTRASVVTGFPKKQGASSAARSKREFQDSPTRAKAVSKRARLNTQSVDDNADVHLGEFTFNEEEEINTDFVPALIGKVSCDLFSR